LIRIETEEWNKGQVISIVSPPNNASCPADTDTITGTFSGINERCNYLGGGYRIGSCNKREGLSTSSGLKPTKFNKFDD
jgi:hypothetical protein